MAADSLTLSASSAASTTHAGSEVPARLTLRSALAVGSGLLLGAAFEPTAIGWLVPLAVAGLVLAVRDVSLLRSALLGYLFGVAFMGVLLFWFEHSISFGAWVGISLVEAVWLSVAAVGMRLVLGLPGGPLWAPSVWVLVELARQAVPFGGFPWGRVGFAVVNTAWSGWLPYLGVTGTGLVLAAVGTVGAWAVRGRTLGAGALLAVVVGVSLLPLLAPYAPSASGAVTVAAVQAGVPGHGNDVPSNHRQITRNLVGATTALAQDAAAGRAPTPELVVWPENSTAVDPVKDREARAGIDEAAAALAALGTPLLVGGPVDASSPVNVLNQGIVWNAQGPTGERYTKRHPVPFGEYIPLRSVLGGLSGRFEQIPRDMLPGTGSSPWSVGGLEVAGAICFDIAYDDVVVPQVRNGAEIVIVQTSNATFVGTAQLEQQLAITRARAAESGRSTVVASLNGVTALIDQQGEVVARVAARDTDVLVGDVLVSTNVTPAVRFAGAVRWAVVISALAGLAWAVGRAGVRRRAGRPTQPGSCGRAAPTSLRGRIRSL